MTESLASTSPPRRCRYLRDPVFLAAAGLYVVNRFVVKPLTGDPSDFFHCHLNDVLCIPFWVPPALWIARGLGLRTHDAPPTRGELALMLLVWSWLFEVFAPAPYLHHWFPESVGDWRDIVAYTAGALFAAVWWRSGRAPPRDAATARLTRVHVWNAAVIVLLATAVTVGVLVQRAWQEPQRRFDVLQRLDARAEHIEAFRRAHGRLPANLDELPEAWPPRDAAREVYRPDGQRFVLIDLGEDRAPGGHGDDADVFLPRELQPRDPWYEYWLTDDGRDAVAAGTMLGFVLASTWLVWRWRWRTGFRPLQLRDLVTTAVGLVFAIAVGVFVLAIQNQLSIPSGH